MPVLHDSIHDGSSDAKPQQETADGVVTVVGTVKGDLQCNSVRIGLLVTPSHTRPVFASAAGELGNTC